jgi:hypothetical protein
MFSLLFGYTSMFLTTEVCNPTPLVAASLIGTRAQSHATQVRGTTLGYSIYCQRIYRRVRPDEPSLVRFKTGPWNWDQPPRQVDHALVQAWRWSAPGDVSVSAMSSMRWGGADVML